MRNDNESKRLNCNFTGKVKLVLFLLGAFIEIVHYGISDHLTHEKMKQRCDGFGALLWILEVMIIQQFLLGLSMVICDKAVDAVLAFWTMACVAEVY